MYNIETTYIIYNIYYYTYYSISYYIIYYYIILLPSPLAPLLLSSHRRLPSARSLHQKTPAHLNAVAAISEEAPKKTPCLEKHVSEMNQKLISI